MIQVAKKSVRILNKAPLREHCKSLFVRSKLLTVINLHIFVCSLNFKKHINAHVPRSIIHNHDTRNKHSSDVPYCRLSKTHDSYHCTGLQLFNTLCADSRKLEFKIFKERLYRWLVVNPFYDTTDSFKLKVVIF